MSWFTKARDAVTGTVGSIAAPVLGGGIGLLGGLGGLGGLTGGLGGLLGGLSMGGMAGMGGIGTMGGSGYPGGSYGSSPFGTGGQMDLASLLNSSWKQQNGGIDGVGNYLGGDGLA